VPREVTHRYEDPLDRIWIGCAQRIGLVVERDPSAFATTDGRGRLLLATDEHLDGDDCLAQMIFHELCHSLVEGPDSLTKSDWGLDNETLYTEGAGKDDVREHACLRLQALLTRPLGLARVLAPTTDFRSSYWDAIGPDPLDPPDDPAVVLARAAALRVESKPWGPHLGEALRATAEVARQVAQYGAQDGASLWSLVDPPRPWHPSGLARAAEGSRAHAERCGTCAWASPHGRGLRCLKAERAVRAEWKACERWEGTVECGSCGACCREAFDTLLLAPRERMVRKHPELVVVRDSAHEMPRPEGRCAALDGDGAAEPYACRTYDDRPRTCRDFTRKSANCLYARRRVGLSY